MNDSRLLRVERAQQPLSNDAVLASGFAVGSLPTAGVVSPGPSSSGTLAPAVYAFALSRIKRNRTTIHRHSPAGDGVIEFNRPESR